MLSQETYIDVILTKFNFLDQKLISIPMDPNIQLLHTQSPKMISEIAYMKNIPYRLRCLVREVFHPLAHPTPLHLDSQSAIMLTKDGSFHAHTKHIDIRYHFICFSIDKGSFHIIYCPTDSMVADTLTKALPSIKAKHFASSLGLRTI